MSKLWEYHRLLYWPLWLLPGRVHDFVTRLTGWSMVRVWDTDTSRTVGFLFQKHYGGQADTDYLERFLNGDPDFKPLGIVGPE